MPTITVASFNIEWMNDWFTPDAQPVALRPNFVRDGDVNDTAITAGRVARVIRAIDPELLAIQEGPSRRAELNLFVQEFLSDGGTPRYECFLGDTGAAQKIGLLYKPDVFDAATLAEHAAIADLIDPWAVDVDGDGVLDEYHFTRTPLVVNVQLAGQPLQLIAMHTKSNFINNGQELWENPATRQNYIVTALKNRRRISAEGQRVRSYIDRVLAGDPAAKIIVLGDLNDGPGLDYFEERYLTHNVTDILVGSAFQPEWVFAHAQHDVPAAERFTAIFDDFVTGEADKHLLLDHVLVSPGLQGGVGLRRVPGSGRVHHEAFEAEVQAGGAKREDRPSDHRPGSVQLTL